ncbi:restriction endonuclease subunit S [Enterococcus faecium]|uniref:restriction endonuclease subunit S n=1 Tax=Enterococcus faecium TaxID=1352 RepID=UPI000F4E43E1|nr:restriction endonuclease subunit S [Enterococcus faecium]ROX44831.1 restriction endonuclease subunit S [Enterococcus faecium]
MKFKEIQLGNLFEAKYGKSLPKNQRRDGNIKVYGSGGISGYHDTALVKGPGIVIGRKGTVGSLYYEKQDYFPIDTTYYIEKSDKYDLKYIFYLLNTLNLNKMNTHSAVPGLNRENLYSLMAKVPEKKYQIKISEFLQQLDSKIEINNQIISNLEELASTLFKRWFVEFEFPDENGNPYKSSGGKMVDSELGKIPEGWEATSLSDIANYKNGLAMQKFRPDEDEESLPVLKIKELNQGFTDSNSDRCSIDISDEVKIENGDVVFSWSGTLLVKIWTGGDAGLNQHLFKVTSNKFPKWYYYLWTKFYMNKFIGIAKDKATTMGHIKRQHLNEAKVLIPSIDMLEKFGKVLGPTIDMVTEKGIENLELSNLRDSLLPKLLSGEIELSEDEEV